MYEFPFASEHNTNSQQIEHNVTNICMYKDITHNLSHTNSKCFGGSGRAARVV